MKLIVAVDREWGIGYRGELLARVRADLLHFQRLTTGKIVVLGSNTLSTFPGGRVLKNRTNLVLNPDVKYQPEGAVVVHNLDELFETLRAYPSDDVFVIGGASVYRQLLPYCDTAYVTRFDRSFEKDACFPDLYADGSWVLTEVGDTQYSDPATDTVPDLPFRFTVYRRK